MLSLMLTSASAELSNVGMGPGILRSLSAQEISRKSVFFFRTRELTSRSASGMLLVDTCPLRSYQSGSTGGGLVVVGSLWNRLPFRGFSLAYVAEVLPIVSFAPLAAAYSRSVSAHN